MSRSLIGRRVVRFGIAIYVLSFVLPTDVVFTNVWPGLGRFISGFASFTNAIDGEFVQFVIWSANPLFWLAIALSRQDRLRGAMIATTAALIVLAAGTLQIYDLNGIQLVAIADVGWAIQAAGDRPGYRT